MNPLVISAFPCTGKSWCCEHPGVMRMADSDSSKFSWSEPGVRNPEFPDNYMANLISLMAEGTDVIFISSHKVVRDALRRLQIPAVLVYPERLCKGEYLERARERGSDAMFLDVLDGNWNAWIDEMNRETGFEKIVLCQGEHLEDALRRIIKGRIANEPSVE